MTIVAQNWKERALGAWEAEETERKRRLQDWRDLQFGRTVEAMAAMDIAHPSDIHYAEGGRATLDGITFGIDEQIDVLFLCAPCKDCGKWITSHRATTWELLGRILEQRPCQDSSVWWHEECAARQPSGPPLLVAAKAAHEALDLLWHDFSEWPPSVTAAMFDLRAAIDSADHRAAASRPMQPYRDETKYRAEIDSRNNPRQLDENSEAR